jgi:hypothetical protein
VTPAEILTKAADLIEPEGAWTQASFARVASGEKTVPEDPAAVCWCLSGALSRVSSEAVFKDRSAAFDALYLALDDDGVFGWNDAPGRTQAEVVAKLREAATLASSDPSS